MSQQVSNSETYHYAMTGAAHTDAYLLPIVQKELEMYPWQTGEKRIFEIGCGNGATAEFLTQRGYSITGIDPSVEGMAIAQKERPNLRLKLGSAYDDLSSEYGQFPVVLSLEVVEHLYFPRKFAENVFRVLQPGGIAIISTPYHSYWKNLVLAVTGKMDKHYTALWDHGHIKFWSRKTLTILLEEAGLKVLRFNYAGRIPPLAKSFVTIAIKPT